MKTDYFKYGIVLSIISLAGVIMLYKFVKEDQSFIKEDGQPLGGFYGFTMRKYKLLLFLILFFFGLCLIYNGIAYDYNFPLIFENIFGKPNFP